MADTQNTPDTPELRARWGSFAWSKENKKKADYYIAKYPEGRAKSSTMPLPDATAILGAIDVVFGECYR